MTVMFNAKIFSSHSEILIRRKLKSLRNYSTQCNNKDYSTGELNKLAKELIKNRIWPMENEQYREQVILLKKREEIRLGKQCTDIFNNSEELIKTLRSEELTERKLVLNGILEDASKKLESLTWKIIAIELVSVTSGATTSGIDGLSFQKIAARTDTKTRAIKILNDEIVRLKREISLAKGKTNQVIQRKGLSKLNEREKLRRWYKKEGRKVIIENRIKLKTLTDNPIKVANNIRECSINYNRNLKFKLLDNLKYNKLKNYRADAIKRVYIPKESSGKLRPLGILTLKDRCVHMLLKLVLEPIMEPLGDSHSFGYRRGRSAHLAISSLSNSLVFKRRGGDMRMRQKTFKRSEERLKRKEEPKKVPEFFTTKYIVDCDIEGFFDNISHNWLINNVPMPKNYEHILGISLKSPIIYENKVINLNCESGLIQGGIISPLLANWTLDGLESRLKKNEQSRTNHAWSGYFYPPGKDKFLFDRKLLDNLTPRRTLERKGGRNVVSCIRYADDIIIVTNNKELLNIIFSDLNTFLSERGLSLSEVKTKVIPWVMGNKLNYLGWTYMLIKPKRVMWMIKAKRSIAGKLRDWAGMYCFPSRESTKNLRNNVKRITSMKNTYKSVGDICQELSFLIRGWSNYFSPGGKQSALRTYLDFYIDKRCRRYLFRKYGSAKIAWAVNYFCRLNNKYIGLHTKNDKGIPSRLWVPFLYKLSVDAPWSLIKPDAELIKNSCIVNPLPYIKRKILLDYLNKKEHGILYKNQKGICPCCNHQLQMYMNNDDNIFLKETESYYGPSHREEGISKRKNNEWDYLHNSYKGLEIDHLIPLGISINIPKIYRILDQIWNKQLIHSHCHKIKTKEDKIMIKKFKEIVKRNNNSNKIELMESFKKAILDDIIKREFGKYKSYKFLIKDIKCIK